LFWEEVIVSDMSKAIEDMRREIEEDALSQLVEEIRKPVKTIKLSDGRTAQIQIKITTEPDEFLE